MSSKEQQGSQINVTGLFTELNRFGKNQEYERALRTTNKILKLLPDDSTALHCKVVCLIQLSKFDDAQKLLNKLPADIISLLPFEKAYCQYRLNQVPAALATLQGIANPNNKVQELLGQVLYRLEKYQESYEVYRELIKNSSDDFEDERETNLAAVFSGLSSRNDPKAIKYGLREETFELAYNSACYFIGQRDYAGAEGKLHLAENLCQKRLETDDDITEEEIEQDLEIIRVQLAYVLQVQDKTAKASNIYNQVLKQKPSDIAVTAVASNNIVCLNKDQNLFDSKKKMRVATADGLHHKLNSLQQKSVAVNQCLLALYSNQAEQCRHLTNQLQVRYPESDAPHIILVAELCRSKQVAKAIQYMQNYLHKTTADDKTFLLLILAQLFLIQGNVKAACERLQSLGDFSYKPGVVSALVTLSGSIGDRTSASSALTEAINWYKENKPQSPDLVVLIQESSQFHLKHGLSDTAVKMLEELHSRDSHDVTTLAQLIMAYAQADPKKAAALSKKLPPVADLSGGIDVDALESVNMSVGGATKYMKKVAAKQDGSPSVPATDEKTKYRKKKKKGKLPKNYDSGVDPDPERWLPKRERSGYKSRKKDKRKDIGKGTQGAITSMGDMETGKVPPAGSGPSQQSPKPGATQSAPQGPRQQKPQPQTKKKKKKGGRW